MGVGPLDHDRVTSFVRDGVHERDWNAINFGQIDKLGIVLASCPLCERLGLLEATFDCYLVKIHEGTSGDCLNTESEVGAFGLGDFSAIFLVDRRSVSTIEVINSIVFQCLIVEHTFLIRDIFSEIVA